MWPFHSKTYESYLFHENVKLEDKCRSLLRENKGLHEALIKAAHGLYDSGCARKRWEASRDAALQGEFANAKRETINPHSSPIKEGSKDWYYFTGEILKQDKEIQQLKHENQRLRDKIVDVSTRNIESHKELAMYKEFFAGNEVKVFLKDKEVKVEELKT